MVSPASVDLSSARSLLFVPGDRPERFDKAAAAGAHVVILDLEDAVDESGKDAARDHVRKWLQTVGAGVVRINAADSPHHRADCEALSGLPGVLAVMLAKAELVDDAEAVSDRVGAPVIALVETALGLSRATELAAAGGVVRLAFGSVDFSADIDAVEGRESLLLARSTLVLAARLAGSAKPIDGVSTSLENPDAVADDSEYARSLGFGGKLCIHPRQVAAVNAAFGASAAELAWARTVLETSTTGAARVNGQMVDKAVLAQARRLLALEGE